jgi:hypothetical protein
MQAYPLYFVPSCNRASSAFLSNRLIRRNQSAALDTDGTTAYLRDILRRSHYPDYITSNDMMILK